MTARRQPLEQVVLLVGTARQPVGFLDDDKTHRPILADGGPYWVRGQKLAF